MNVALAIFFTWLVVGFWAALFIGAFIKAGRGGDD